MTIRHALFIDGAWQDTGMDSLSALVTVDDIGIEMRPYTNAEITDVVRFTFEEFAAIADMVTAARDRYIQEDAQP